MIKHNLLILMSLLVLNVLSPVVHAGGETPEDEGIHYTRRFITPREGETRYQAETREIQEYHLQLLFHCMRGCKCKFNHLDDLWGVIHENQVVCAVQKAARECAMKAAEKDARRSGIVYRRIEDSGLYVSVYRISLEQLKNGYRGAPSRKKLYKEFDKDIVKAAAETALKFVDEGGDFSTLSPARMNKLLKVVSSRFYEESKGNNGHRPKRAALSDSLCQRLAELGSRIEGTFARRSETRRPKASSFDWSKGSRSQESFASLLRAREDEAREAEERAGAEPEHDASEGGYFGKGKLFPSFGDEDADALIEALKFLDPEHPMESPTSEESGVDEENLVLVPEFDVPTRSRAALPPSYTVEGFLEANPQLQGRFIAAQRKNGLTDDHLDAKGELVAPEWIEKRSRWLKALVKASILGEDDAYPWIAGIPVFFDWRKTMNEPACIAEYAEGHPYDSGGSEEEKWSWYVGLACYAQQKVLEGMLCGDTSMIYMRFPQAMGSSVPEHFDPQTCLDIQPELAERFNKVQRANGLTDADFNEKGELVSSSWIKKREGWLKTLVRVSLMGKDQLVCWMPGVISNLDWRRMLINDPSYAISYHQVNPLKMPSNQADYWEWWMGLAEYVQAQLMEVSDEGSESESEEKED